MACRIHLSGTEDQTGGGGRGRGGPTETTDGLDRIRVGPSQKSAEQDKRRRPRSRSRRPDATADDIETTAFSTEATNRGRRESKKKNPRRKPRLVDGLSSLGRRCPPTPTLARVLLCLVGAGRLAHSRLPSRFPSLAALCYALRPKVTDILFRIEIFSKKCLFSALQLS